MIPAEEMRGTFMGINKTNFHKTNDPLLWIHVGTDTWMILEGWYIWSWCRKCWDDHIHLCQDTLDWAVLCSLLDTRI